jgi:hypothetical protein
MSTVGIRREDKHEWEARAPLTPEAVGELVVAGIGVVVQPSITRAFPDAAYAAAGATIAEDMSGCEVVLAVKEVPVAALSPGAAYVFFSHTIKGQPQNMPMLRRMAELGCTLIDYERIVDDEGRRLVFFGRHAGLAGMIDTLWVLGRRLAELGEPSPFCDLRLTHEYEGLAAAEEAVREVGAALRDEPLPASRAPFVVGFSGYGNVSRGAQEIFRLLPHSFVEPGELAALTARAEAPRDHLFGVVFEERHLVEPLEGSFDKADYFAHPERYRSAFDQHLAHLSVLVNAIYWTDRYPRLVTRDFLRAGGARRLVAIGDISCDIEGSVECTVKATTPGMPSYIYDPSTGAIRDGWEGPGIAMMTTDCLPCELPREATESFTEALARYVPALASLDRSLSFEVVDLPAPIRRATILWNGELTPDHHHLAAKLGG